MKKEQGDQMHFSLEKKTRKKKMNSSNSSYQSMDCVIKWVFDSSILLEIFSFIWKCSSCDREKTAERWDKKNEWVASVREMIAL